MFFDMLCTENWPYMLISAWPHFDHSGSITEVKTVARRVSQNSANCTQKLIVYLGLPRSLSWQLHVSLSKYQPLATY